MKEDLAALAEKLCPGVVPVERGHGDFVSVAYVFPMGWGDFLRHRAIGRNGGSSAGEPGCVTAYFNGGYFKPVGCPVIVSSESSELPRETMPCAYVPFLNLPVAELPAESQRFVMRSHAQKAQLFVNLETHHTLYAKVSANARRQGVNIVVFEYLKICPHLTPDEQTMMLVGIYQKQKYRKQKQPMALNHRKAYK